MIQNHIQEKSMINNGRNERERLSNFELLRVIAMTMIIGHHLAIHSGFEVDKSLICFNRFVLEFLQSGGKFGVVLFVMISGYFSIKKTDFKLKKLLTLWGMVEFYSVLFAVCHVLTGGGITLNELKSVIFPLISEEYWFITAYFLLMIISPVINRGLLQLSKEEFSKFLCIIIFVWTVIPIIFNISFQGNNVIHFFVIYTIGGYLRLYGFKFTERWIFTKCLVVGILGYLCLFLSCVIIDYVGIYVEMVRPYSQHLFKTNSFFLIVIAVIIFSGFKKLNLCCNNINNFAKLTLGIYLIHDNRYIRPFLWEKLFHNSSLYHSSYLMLYSVLEIFSVLICCGIVEYLRQYIVERVKLLLLKRKKDNK